VGLGGGAFRVFDGSEYGGGFLGLWELTMETRGIWTSTPSNGGICTSTANPELLTHIFIGVALNCRHGQALFQQRRIFVRY
jgi:hypothetical protein